MTVAIPDTVGRDRELAAVDEFLQSAETFPGALVLEGEAGIGKTTLLQAGVVRARGLSVRVLEARPVQAESTIPFAALGDLLAGGLGQVLTGLPEPQSRALRVAVLLDEPDGPPPDHRAIGVGLLGALRALSDSGPVLLAVDDLQWLDRASATVLQFAVRRLRDERIGLLAAFRSGQQRLPLEIDRVFEGERLRRVRVGPLSLGASNRLIRDRLDITFPRPVLRRIHETSGGNPLFALQLARALDRRGGQLDPGERLTVPQELRRHVRGRLDVLAVDTRFALAAAAALSQPTVQVISSAAGGDDHVLDPAVEAEMVEIEGGRVRFTHPLLASGAYEGVVDRADLYRRLADVVDDPEERARHLALATNEPNEAVAGLVEDAAAAARRRGAVAQAAELAAQARRLTPGEGSVRKGVGGRSRRPGTGSKQAMLPERRPSSKSSSRARLPVRRAPTCSANRPGTSTSKTTWARA